MGRATRHSRSGVPARRVVIAQDARFFAERARFSLLHTCEDCAYFCASAGTCAHGWPNAPHRAAWYDPAASDGRAAEFCKEWEAR